MISIATKRRHRQLRKAPPLGLTREIPVESKQ
jgi:hypothetical protein